MQQFQEYDLYYSPDQAYSLLSYPLLADTAHLSLASCHYQPLQRRLELGFKVDCPALEVEDPALAYESRLIHNGTRMVHSRFDEAKKCFVWTSVDASLEMLPKFKGKDIPVTAKQKDREELEELMKLKELHRFVEGKMRNFNFLQAASQEEGKEEWRMLGEEDRDNSARARQNRAWDGGFKGVTAVGLQKYMEEMRMGK